VFLVPFPGFRSASRLEGLFRRGELTGCVSVDYVREGSSTHSAPAGGGPKPDHVGDPQPLSSLQATPGRAHGGGALRR